MGNRFRLSLLALGILCAAQAQAEIGSVLPAADLERWGALALGLNGPGSRMFGNALIQGDAGVAGAGSIALTSPALIQGDLYYRNSGSLHLPSGTGVSGTVYNGQSALLDQEVDDALALAKAAGSLASTRSNTFINLRGTASLTLSGAPGETVVLNLSNFTMSGNSLLTLNGAANTTFVINVNRGFSLTNAAQIVLSGGLDWNDVLFNVRGKGPAVQINGSASFQGILLATRRSVQMRNSALVRGEVIADALSMQGPSQIIHPPVVSP